MMTNTKTSKARFVTRISSNKHGAYKSDYWAHKLVDQLACTLYTVTSCLHACCWRTAPHTRQKHSASSESDWIASVSFRFSLVFLLIWFTLSLPFLFFIICFLLATSFLILTAFLTARSVNTAVCRFLLLSHGRIYGAAFSYGFRNWSFTCLLGCRVQTVRFVLFKAFVSGFVATFSI